MGAPAETEQMTSSVAGFIVSSVEPSTEGTNWLLMKRPVGTVRGFPLGRLIVDETLDLLDIVAILVSGGRGRRFGLGRFGFGVDDMDDMDDMSIYDRVEECR